MSDIYTPEWYEALKDLINSNGEIQAKAPKGAWVAKIEIKGDGKSPYVADGEMRSFIIRIEDGQCVWYKEVDSDEGYELDYRFTGAASVFDEVAASITDPVDAGLDGRIRVRGDMRFLLRQAELVKEVLQIYSSELATDWPKGEPPYS